MDINSNEIRISFTKSQINGKLAAQYSFIFFFVF